jgi:hypothetical protein
MLLANGVAVSYLFNSNVLLQAVGVRPLSSVNALVRFAEEPQMFAIEFNDGSPVYVSLPQIKYKTPI